MITKRDFLQAAGATALLTATSLGGLGRAAAQQKLDQKQLLAFEPFGNVTLLHLTDLHAQLVPIWFREPSINLGVGDAKGKAPHLTDAAFRNEYKIAAGSADAHSLTSEDFNALAKNYGKMGGLDRMATLIKAIRAERGENKVLLLDGGDTWQGSWTSLKTNGADVVAAMNLLKPEAMVSHWEFTFGEKRVKEIVDSLAFPFLAQNIRSKEWQEEVFPAAKTFEKNGVRIAVIGQAFPRTPISNPNWMFPDWEFGLREEDMQKQVDKARNEGADCVVILSHNGFDVDRKMASRVKGIDVILTAHTHDALPQALQVGQTLLIASGSHGKFLSRLDLDVKGKKVTGFRYRLIPVFSDAITPDAEMKALIEKSRAPYLADLNRHVGVAPELLYRRGNFDGTWDNLFCDAMLQQRDAEIALSPGIRWGASVLEQTPIRFEDITNACAMSYPACYRQEMSGGQIKDMLEDIADNIFHPDPYFQGGGDMVRVGGLSYAIDVSQSIGKRISNLSTTRNNQPLDANKKYVVSGWGSVSKTVEGPAIWDVVENHIKSQQPLKPAKRNSVTITGG